MSLPLNHAKLRRTKIVCTIGPATNSASMIEKLAKAGMDCARLNFSHGKHSDHLRLINLIRRVSKKVGKQIAVMQDLPGPKLRVGRLKNGSVHLRKGSVLSLTTEDIVGDEKRIPVRHNDLPRYIPNSAAVFLSDGSVRLKVLGTDSTEIRCRCESGGELLSGKGMNIPHLKHEFETFTGLDKQHLEFGLKNDVDLVAISFVRNDDDIKKVRKFIGKKKRNGGDRPSIIAKIEKKDAVENIEDIVRASDAVMVARGDLGVENPVEQVPIIQKSIISHCNRMAVPVITATQMLESMVNNSRPTRAEVTDIATAIFDGTDAVMLSEETAVGKHPAECVNVLHRVSLTTEGTMLANAKHAVQSDLLHEDIGDATSEAANQISIDIGAKLLVSPTNSGYMAAKISRFRPRAPVIALTDNPKMLRRLMICWGVYPIQIRRTDDLTGLLDVSLSTLAREKLVKRGEKMVIVCDGVRLSREIGTLLFVVECR
ncbi:MAG: pyruvate kinase [Nitrososphaerales archaeon]